VLGKAAFGIACVIGAVIAAWFAGIAVILLIEWITSYDALGKFDGDKGELGEHLTILAYGVPGGAAAWDGYVLYEMAERNLSHRGDKRRARQRRVECLERENRELRGELDERKHDES
jgi:hypothetical protein